MALPWTGRDLLYLSQIRNRLHVTRINLKFRLVAGLGSTLERYTIELSYPKSSV